jgi:parvulin-like peptidyl-prolyl isomerase
VLSVPAIALVACALAPAARAGEPAPADDDAVARVNGEPITRAELVGELLVRHGSSVLEDMIRQRAVEREMARAGITVGEEEIDAELRREREAFASRAGEKRTLEQMVAEKYSMSMAGYRAIVRRYLLVRKMILRRERPTEAELMLWFYNNQDRYDEPAEVTVRHLFVAKADPLTGGVRTDAELMQRKQRIRDGIVLGEDFAKLVRRWSDDPATKDSGGMLGTVNERAARTHLEPAFAEAMLALKPGQTGGPVETPQGYHFIQVTARKEGREVAYEEVAARVRLDHEEERVELMKDAFVRDLMDRVEVTRSFTPPERPARDDGAAGEAGAEAEPREGGD